MAQAAWRVMCVVGASLSLLASTTMALGSPVALAPPDVPGSGAGGAAPSPALGMDADAGTASLDAGVQAPPVEAAPSTERPPRPASAAEGARPSPGPSAGPPGAGKAAGPANAGKKPGDQAADPWVLRPSIVVAVDAYHFAGSGVSRYQRADGSALGGGYALQWVRPAIVGKFLDNWSFMAIAELSAPNSRGPQQTFAFRGGILDGWIAYRHSEALAFKFGQFTPPLTLEVLRPPAVWDSLNANLTGSLAIPGAGKDIGLMMYGTPGPFVYAIGSFNGEGRNRISVDQYGDVVGRAAVRVNREGSNRFQVGVSGKYGLVDPRSSWADAAPLGLITGSGYQFWTPSYATTAPVGLVRVLPADAQVVMAADLILELGDFSIQAEGARFDLNRREVLNATPQAEDTLRSGALTGYSYYVTAGYWLFNATPALKSKRWESAVLSSGGKEKESSYKPSLHALARFEQLHLKYDSVSRSGPEIERGLLDQYTRDIRVDAVQMNLSLWISTHLRFIAEWSVYHFPGEQLADGRRVSNQALAPGAVVPGEGGTARPAQVPIDVSPVWQPSFFTPAAPDARFLHEFSARAQVAF